MLSPYPDIGEVKACTMTETVVIRPARRTAQRCRRLPRVRGDEARPEFERAAALTHNARERKVLLERARAYAGGMTRPEPL